MRSPTPGNSSDVRQPAAAFASDLLAWFRRHAREFPWRAERDPYRVLVAEKLLQQTDAGHVLKVYDAFLRRFPTLDAVAATEEHEIAALLRPLGFWRLRARDLRRMASEVRDQLAGRFPRDVEELRALSGVGPYIANAVACFAFGQQRAVVDVNVRRVMSRLLFWGRRMPTDEGLQDLLRGVMPNGRAREFNWAMLDFAALVCRRRPKCEICFAQSACQYFQNVVAVQGSDRVSR